MFHVKHESPDSVNKLDAALHEAGGTPAHGMLSQLADWLAIAGRSTGLTHYSTSELVVTRGMMPAVGIVRVAVESRAGSFAEIGPGSGALGLAVAVALPALPVVLLDRRPKCVTFIETTAARLRLQNVRVQVATLPVDDPSEVGGPFDVVAVRAFAAGPVAIQAAASIVREGGRVLWLHRAGEAANVVSPDGVRYVSTVQTGVDGLDMTEFSINGRG
jgi:16S rRNA G527 N7-methylase RsmG